MKLFRFGALLIALTVLLGTTTYAQGKGKDKGKGEAHGQGHAEGHGQGHENKSPEERAKARTNWMKNKLGIDATQEQSVYNIYLASFEEMKKIRETVQGPDKRTQIEAVRNNMESQLKGALTAEQYAAYLKIKEERKAKGERDDDDDNDKGTGGGKGQTTPKTQTAPSKGSTKKG